MLKIIQKDPRPWDLIPTLWFMRLIFTSFVILASISFTQFLLLYSAKFFFFKFYISYLNLLLCRFVFFVIYVKIIKFIICTDSLKFTEGKFYFYFINLLHTFKIKKKVNEKSFSTSLKYISNVCI